MTQTQLAGMLAGRVNQQVGIIRLGFATLTIGLVLLIPIVPRADSGWWLVIPLMIAGCGLGVPLGTIIAGGRSGVPQSLGQ